MARISPVLLNDIKVYFRKQKIIVNVSVDGTNRRMHFTKRKGVHYKEELHDIVVKGLYLYWSDFKIIEENSMEITACTNPLYTRVIKDDPSLAFKLGLHYVEILHKYECVITKNPELGHLILEFKSEEDAIAFCLEYG